MALVIGTGITIGGGIYIGSGTGVTYATWDPSNNFNGSTLSEDNLTQLTYTGYTAGGGGNGARGTIGKTTGKWYFEYTPTVNISSSQAMGVGITGNYSSSLSVFETSSQAFMWYFNGAGNISATYENGAYTPTGSYAITTSDIGGIAFDLDGLTIKYYKNGTLITTSSLPSGQTWYPISANGSTAGASYGVTANFGATSLIYLPSGFSPIQNSAPPGTPELLIVKGTYPATTTTGSFDFISGGSVGFTGHEVFSGAGIWGPQQLFDNTRSNFDWCSFGDTTNTFGQWVFPVSVTVTDIFIVPRLQNDNFPTQVEVVVNGTVVDTYTPTTITYGVSGQYIDYTGTGYKITLNETGTTWRLNFNQTNVYIGEIEFWGYIS